MKTIVVSAVNLRKGGTLAILRECLNYLSEFKSKFPNEYRVVAIVHKESLAQYKGVEYIEIPWSIKSWIHRLWCEYVTLLRISKRIEKVDLWLSLHDTTPRVSAKRQAVYCQTSFPFLKLKAKDFLFNFKIPLFALFTRFAYQINIRRNKCLIVQQEWLREGFGKMFGISQGKFIVAPPERKSPRIIQGNNAHSDKIRFIYPASPDCHKNFELLCRATEVLEQEEGTNSFVVTITIKGDENRYARWLRKKWGHISSIEFAGFLSRTDLEEMYARADCLVFPSRVETWGLPISEFLPYEKPMLLADLPYAHETSKGAKKVQFFDVSNARMLKQQMQEVLYGNRDRFISIPETSIAQPYAKDWHELFQLLLE